MNDILSYKKSLSIVIAFYISSLYLFSFPLFLSLSLSCAHPPHPLQTLFFPLSLSFLPFCSPENLRGEELEGEWREEESEEKMGRERKGRERGE
jgi:hypothetical protein